MQHCVYGEGLQPSLTRRDQFCAQRSQDPATNRHIGKEPRGYPGVDKPNRDCLTRPILGALRCCLENSTANHP